MNQAQLKNRLSELKDLINRYSYEYHVLDKPTVSNDVWDSLLAELKKIEAEHPELITNDSPTQRVGSEISTSFSKVKHKTRMISLNDVFSRGEVEAWAKRMDSLLTGESHQFFTDIKMDGLACSVVYQDGVFSQAITRGDGFVGEDVSDNVRTIKNVPLRLIKNKGYEHFLTGRTEFRGEIVMLKQDFIKLNQQRELAGRPVFANPRNLAAGTIRQLDPKIVASRPLQFRVYDVIRDETAEVPTWLDAYKIATALGLTRNQEAAVFDGLKEVMDFVDEWDKKRDSLPFGTDGLVVKINNRQQYDKLGIVGKQPRAAVAYKYAPETATAVVRDIIISIGRTGAATPVAVFEPTSVAGTIIKHASLHNADEIIKKDIRIGDTVVIYKAGDIIPQIESVIIPLRPKQSQKFDFEKILKKQYPDLEFSRPDGEAVYRLKGSSSKIILKKALEHFASKAALDIENLGDKNVAVLVDTNLVKDVADIYKLKYEDIVRLDRFADISAKKLISAIQSTKQPSLEKFIYGLGIRHIGVQTAIDLVKEFKSIKNLQSATIEELRVVEGVGEVVAESVMAWFCEPDNQDLLKKFDELGVKPVYKQGIGRLDGKSFVVTGTLVDLSREDLADKIRQQGGIFQSAIAKDTDYLVVGDKAGSSKLKKAKQFNTKVISEQQLKEILE